jgi:hypothetical protein
LLLLLLLDPELVDAFGSVDDVLEVDGSLPLESPPEPNISDNPENPSLIFILLFTGDTVFIKFLKYEFVILLFLLLLIYYNILY